MTAKEAYDYSMKQGERYRKIQAEIKHWEDNILEACIKGETSYSQHKIIFFQETIKHFVNLGYTVDFFSTRQFISWGI